jgi:YD repeat-containing protein
MPRSHLPSALLLTALALSACKRSPEQPLPSPEVEAAPSAETGVPAPAAAPTEAARPDASPDVVDAGPAAVLTVRVINASAAPLTVYTNPDTNELIHTRKLWSRRNSDASTDGELVKFFPVGQMPLCSQDGGAGYGGLGQPEQRTLAPGEAMEFAWDGQQRREVLDPRRGVCAEIVEPEAARYRFEFDQPYNAPQCNRPVIQWPLAEDAPRVIEIRCQPRARRER